MSIVKLKDVDRLRGVLAKGLKIQDVMFRIELAQRQRVVKQILIDLDDARELYEDMQAYHQAEAEVYKEHGTAVTSPDGKQMYKISDWEPVVAKLEALQVEHANAIQKDWKRREAVGKLLDGDVDLDIHKMKNEWFGDLINGDDVELLLDMDLLAVDQAQGRLKSVPKKKAKRAKK